MRETFIHGTNLGGWRLPAPRALSIVAVVVATVAPAASALGMDVAVRQAEAAEALNWISAIAAGLTFVNTLLLVVTLYLTRQATKAATIAARAAERTVEHEEHRTKLELRPYVLRAETSAIPLGNGKWRLRIVWKNYGKTPARDVYASSWTRAFDWELPADFNFPTDPSHEIAPFVMGPHGDSMNTDLTVDVDNLQRAFEEGKSVHYWGWIEYGEIHSKEIYRTEYHACLNFKKPPQEEADLVFSFARRFNGTDDECLRAAGTESALRRVK